MANETTQAQQGAGNFRPIVEYGFTEEEAESIALGLALYDQWQEEFLAEPDPRYTKLFREVGNNTDLMVLLLTGFFGGLEKGLEIALKTEEHAKGKAEP